MENGRPTSEDNRAVLRLYIQTDHRAQSHSAAGRHRRDVVKAQKQPREMFCTVAEQEIDAFVQEALGVGIQAERVKEDIARQIVLRGFREPKGDVPGRASLGRLPQQELAQHPECVRPERIAG
ncbi:hypothetical protein D3C85_781700 [compost metagenome]